MVVNRWLKRTFLYVIIAGFAVIFVTPFLWMVSAALQSDTYTMGGQWFRQFLWSNFAQAFGQKDFQFMLAVRNTVFYTVAGTLFFIVSSVSVAYGFSFFRFPFRDKLFFFLLATMMIPSTVMFIPNYVMFANWHWTGTYLPLLIPALGGGPGTIFLLRQFMLTLSVSLFESARMDGANSWTILWRIVLPNIKAPLILVMIQQVNAHWSDFFGPLMYVGNEAATRTLSVALSTFNRVYYVQWSYIMCVALFMAIVPVILYFFSQRFLMQDFVLSATEK
ncbi:carbohydrate ABC transporter permease [Paenibacillus donghaensis]|uniref:carbohydrate ABC transporter permease n=1 Tax=Paenibacillus donghaensis TaxID=414771 RepID=UPI00188441AB|nr:carbohydrate ABC transporter permease [Paenibacillus donghaensis]MBE9915108.1 carbohydrate ABC transporter permease [Paenibacillus donghaensis]